MAPPSLPSAEGVSKLAQHPALALWQRGEAFTGTQQLDVMDDLQQNSHNTKVVAEPVQSNRTAVTQMFDTTLKHTDTLRDGSRSPTKQNAMTPTQNSSQTQAPMVPNDRNSHSSKPTTEAGPRNGPPPASDPGYTIDNPEACPILPSYSEDEVREAIKAILNPATHPISPSHDQGALHAAVKAILSEDSTKAYIKDLTKQYVQEWLNESESAIRAMTREEVRRRIRPAAVRDAGTPAINPAGISSRPIRNPQEQALYQQSMRQHLMQNMQQQARTSSFQQGSSPNLGSFRPESRSATPGQHGTTDNRLSKATDAQPPTLSEVHPPQVPDAEPVTTSNETTYPRTSDPADAGFMSDHHSRNSQKRPGDCTSGAFNK